MKPSKQLLSSIVFSGAILVLTACGGGGNSGGTSVTGAPSITIQPQNASVGVGSSVTFTVAASGSNLRYQWQLNGQPISGATTASYTVPSASYLNAGAYTVVVSNSGGSVTSNGAVLNLSLSPDQQVFENMILAPATGGYAFEWNLGTGVPVTGTNYLDSRLMLLQKSPLTNGPQTITEPYVAVSGSLAKYTYTPTRVLLNGAIVVVPIDPRNVHISYSGSAVRTDLMASDGVTVGISTLMSGFATTTLTGTLGAAPTTLKTALGSIYSNSNVLNQSGVSFAPGSAYMTFSDTYIGDTYMVFDCSTTASTSGNTPIACQTGSTLQSALTAGEISPSDGTTYHLSDGTLSTLGGVPIWVASNPRPASVTAYTNEYRIYIQLNGNVYTGAYIKDGTAENSGTADAQLNGGLRLNKAAYTSLQAGLKF